MWKSSMKNKKGNTSEHVALIFLIGCLALIFQNNVPPLLIFSNIDKR